MKARALGLTFLVLSVAAMPGRAREPAGDPTNAASWSRLTVQLPADRGSFPGGAGAELANTRCLICHSVDMVLTQPTRTVAQWRDTVTKMRVAYGAPVEDSEVDALAAYLAGLQSVIAGR